MTLSDESEESRHDVPPLRSPPLSAVIGSFGSMQSARLASQRHSQQLSQSQTPQRRSQLSQVSASAPEPTLPQPISAQGPPPAYVTPASSRAPLLGTVSSATSDAHSSVTTAMTDPITGAVMHFPSLPYMRGQPPARGQHESYGRESGSDGEHW